MSGRLRNGLHKVKCVSATCCREKEKGKDRDKEAAMQRSPDWPPSPSPESARSKASAAQHDMVAWHGACNGTEELMQCSRTSHMGRVAAAHSVSHSNGAGIQRRLL